MFHLVAPAVLGVIIGFLKHEGYHRQLETWELSQAAVDMGVITGGYRQGVVSGCLRHESYHRLLETWGLSQTAGDMGVITGYLKHEGYHRLLET